MVVRTPGIDVFKIGVKRYMNDNGHNQCVCTVGSAVRKETLESGDISKRKDRVRGGGRRSMNKRKVGANTKTLRNSRVYGKWLGQNPINFDGDYSLTKES